MTQNLTPTISARAIMAMVVRTNKHLTCQAQLEAKLFTALKNAGSVNALALAQAEAQQHIPQRGSACCIGCKAEHAASKGNPQHTELHTH